MGVVRNGERRRWVFSSVLLHHHMTILFSTGSTIPASRDQGRSSIMHTRQKKRRRSNTAGKNRTRAAEPSRARYSMSRWQGLSTCHCVEVYGSCVCVVLMLVLFHVTTFHDPRDVRGMYATVSTAAMLYAMLACVFSVPRSRGAQARCC